MLIVQKLYVNSNSQYKEHKKMTTVENDRSRDDMTTTIRSRIIVDTISKSNTHFKSQCNKHLKCHKVN